MVNLTRTKPWTIYPKPGVHVAIHVSPEVLIIFFALISRHKIHDVLLI